MQPARYAVAAEQQDAKEGGLEEKGGQHFIASQRPDHIAGDDRKAAPVGAELIRQHDAGYDTHGEGYGEDPRPEARDFLVNVPGRPAPEDFQRGDIRRQADGEARENNMEGD